MDSLVHRSSGRGHFIALIALTFISLLVILSSGSDTQSFVRHNRRGLEVVTNGVQKAAATPLNSAAGSSSGAPGTGSGTSSPATTPTLPPSNSTVTTPPPPPPTSTTSTVTNVAVTQTGLTNSTTSSSTHTSSTSLPATSASTTAKPTTTTSSTTSSSSSTTSSSSTFSMTLPPTLLTTLTDPTASQADTPQPTDRSGARSASSAASSSSFWKNTGAVVATFVIIALLFLGIIACVFITIMKKRNARKESQLHEDLFQTYQEVEATYRGNSPGPSINAAPMDPFASREIAYDNVHIPAISVTPSTSDPFMSTVPTAPSASHPSVPTVQVSSAPVQHPDYYNPPRYLPPSQLQSAAANGDGLSSASAIGRRKYELRESTQSGYQPSVDSFYGAGPPSGYTR